MKPDNTVKSWVCWTCPIVFVLNLLVTTIKAFYFANLKRLCALILGGIHSLSSGQNLKQSEGHLVNRLGWHWHIFVSELGVKLHLTAYHITMQPSILVLLTWWHRAFHTHKTQYVSLTVCETKVCKCPRSGEFLFQLSSLKLPGTLYSWYLW